MPTPDGAPKGCQIKFVSFWRDRPTVTPRLLIVHTNAASGEGSMDSSTNWAESSPNSNTLPHYQVDRAYNSQGFIARKMLPTNRKGIGNGTVSQGSLAWPSLSTEDQASIKKHGQSSLFSLVVETADLGYGPGKPGDACHFTPDQAEMVAQIIAYEAELWGFDVEYPEDWFGSGVACHTEPFDYPFWSIFKGKTCPGAAKKADMKDIVMPRAREILAPPPPPDPPPIPKVEAPSMLLIARATNGAVWIGDGIKYRRGMNADEVAHFAARLRPVDYLTGVTVTKPEDITKVADDSWLVSLGTTIA